MLLDLAPLAFAATSESSYSVDCEGPCCCRCHLCAGVGWWSSYDVTFPVSDGEVRCILGVRTFVPGASDIISACIDGLTSSIVAISANYLYGSSGGTGNCIWGGNICPLGGGFFGGSIEFNGTQLVVIYGGVCTGVIYPVISFDCRTGGSFTGDPLVDCLSACANQPHFPSDITIVPTPGATWQQCGQNFDGTPYDGEESFAMMAGLLSNAMGATVKSIEPRPLPVIRPDRCEHLGKRNDFKAGCNGWQCGHNCDLGLPAIPGIFCQTECTKYEVDPDYVGQGPAGWLK